MKLDNMDLKKAIRMIPEDLVGIMCSEMWRNKIYIGGGFLRAVVANETVSDIDIFVQSKQEAELLARKLLKRDSLYTSDNAYTIRRKTPLQFIHRWVFKKPEDVALSFDFTVCCGVIFQDEKGQWDSFCDERFYKDIAAKRLIYRFPERNEDAGGSMIRVLKYYQKGYRIPLHSLGNVIARLIKGIDIEKTGGLEDEERVGKIITSLLVEVDPNGIHQDEE